MLLDHRVAADLQHVVVPATLHEGIGNRERLLMRDRLDRHTGRHGAEQGKLDRARRHLVRQDLDRAALVVRALDVALPLEIAQMLVDGRERVVVEVVGDLLEAWGVALLFRVERQIV